jgi:hypothetical protein
MLKIPTEVSFDADTDKDHEEEYSSDGVSSSSSPSSGSSSQESIGPRANTRSSSTGARNDTAKKIIVSDYYETQIPKIRERLGISSGCDCEDDAMQERLLQVQVQVQEESTREESELIHLQQLETASKDTNINPSTTAHATSASATNINIQRSSDKCKGDRNRQETNEHKDISDHCSPEVNDDSASRNPCPVTLLPQSKSPYDHSQCSDCRVVEVLSRDCVARIRLMHTKAREAFRRLRKLLELRDELETIEMQSRVQLGRK